MPLNKENKPKDIKELKNVFLKYLKKREKIKICLQNAFKLLFKEETFLSKATLSCP